MGISVTGAGVASRPCTLFQSESFDLDSATLGRRYEISVALPFGYHAAPDRRFPVVVVLDASLCFGMAVDISRLLALGGEAEETIVVGVGCPWSEGFEALGKRRSHDFTPTDQSEPSGPFAGVTKALLAMAGIDRQWFGGAPRFLDLLRDELLPLVGRQYRADLTSPGLIGDSSGGTFALFALLSERSPFKRYVIGSPATAQCNDELYRMEERFAEQHADLDARVFLAAGSEEMSSPILEGGGIASGVCRFSGLFALRRYPSLKVTSHFFPDEGHMSVLPAIISRGVRTLWNTGRKYGEMPPA